MRTKEESMKFLEQEEVRDWIGFLKDNLPNYDELWSKFQDSMSECERQPVGNDEQGENKLFDCPSQENGVCRCSDECTWDFPEVK